MYRLVASILCALTLTIAVPAIGSAQTGPIGVKPAAAPAATMTLTKDLVLSKMREAGFADLKVAFEGSKGFFIATATVTHADWNFAVEVLVCEGAQGFYLRSQLTDLPSGTLSASALVRLLEQNRKNPGTMFFQINEATKKIELAQPFMNATDINHLTILTQRFCDVIKNTHGLWRPDALLAPGVSTASK